MRHLIVCREFPPAVYPPGGIGTYVAHISRVLAESGEIVHVIGQRWAGATRRIERLCDGRLIVHRIAPEDSDLYPSLPGGRLAEQEMEAMLRSDFPPQWFSWVAAGLAERLVESEGIDVIEAQEWEAPLYYFLLRRTLGLGPDRKPPCIVHLHSPTEFIFRHNDWPLSRPDYYPMKRLEDFVIKASDAHLCPSRYLASHCVEHYGLAEPVEVIPLPMGSSAEIGREVETWSRGSICFCGRLEPRKGVIEFVDAAISVARDDPTLRFDFVGSDNQFNTRISVQSLVERRIPPELRACFQFHGGKPRDELLRMLGNARIAAVPSRWENFPNTCLEAMGSGLPVLATRNGGMAEMVEDGVTGWLAGDGPEPLADRLAEALRRALAATPQECAAMGRAAAQSIRGMCDNDRIARRHIAFRGAVARRGAHRSTRFPSAFPWPERSTRPSCARLPSAADDRGVAVVVLAIRGGDAVEALRNAHRQSHAPQAVIVVAPEPPRTDIPHHFLPYRGSSRAMAKALAVSSFPNVPRWMFIDRCTQLHPDALEQMGRAMDAVPGAGLVVPWAAMMQSAHPTWAEQPAFPYQWLRNEVRGPALYRREAIIDAGNFRSDIAEGHEDWALATAIMADGWAAPCLPALLASRSAEADIEEATYGQRGHASVQIACRFAKLAGEDVVALLSMLDLPVRQAVEPGSFATEQDRRTGAAQPEVVNFRKLLAMPLRDQLAVALAAAKQPRLAMSWLLWRAKTMLGNWRLRGID
ncbi:MAG: glycosyltransferase family 4 protein [Novosphingobium sp.]